MNEATFTVTFRGEPPAQIEVGDKLTIVGAVTVRSITAELVDVTSFGSEPAFALGEATIDLVANRLAVQQA